MQFREQRREATFDLGQAVIMLSTKAQAPEDEYRYDPISDEKANASSKIRILTLELESIQRKYMAA